MKNKDQEPKSILQGYKPNFETLQAIFENGDSALMECEDTRTGKKVAVVCAVSFDGDEYHIAPFAQMLEGNPYEYLIPPSQEDIASSK